MVEIVQKKWNFDSVESFFIGSKRRSIEAHIIYLLVHNQYFSSLTPYRKKSIVKILLVEWIFLSGVYKDYWHIKQSTCMTVCYVVCCLKVECTRCLVLCDLTAPSGWHFSIDFLIIQQIKIAWVLPTKKCSKIMFGMVPQKSCQPPKFPF